MGRSMLSSAYTIRNYNVLLSRFFDAWWSAWAFGYRLTKSDTEAGALVAEGKSGLPVIREQRVVSSGWNLRLR